MVEYVLKALDRILVARRLDFALHLLLRVLDVLFLIRWAGDVIIPGLPLLHVLLGRMLLLFLIF